MNCKECNKELGKRQTKFCSIRCRNTSNGRTKPPAKKQFHKFCELCGFHYTVKKSLKDKNRFCSRRCVGLNMANIMWRQAS